MAAGFEYFTSADVGAPSLYGAAGRLAAVLDWVLNTKGGWDIAFTGTNLRSYRSQTGNRFYLRLEDTQTRYSRIRAYRAMTGISTGTNQFPTNTQATNVNTWGLVKAAVAGSDVRRYWGVRTNRYVILIVEYATYTVDSLNQREIFIFGDVPTLAGSDAHNTIIQGAYSVDSAYPDLIAQLFSGLNASAAYGGSGGATAAVSGSPDGTVLSPNLGLVLPFGPGTDSSQEATIGKSTRLHMGDVISMCKNTAAASDAGGYPRTRVPNLHQVFGPVRAVVNGNIPCIDLEEFTVGSKTYKCFMRYSTDAPVDTYSTDALLLEITDTDGAL